MTGHIVSKFKNATFYSLSELDVHTNRFFIFFFFVIKPLTVNHITLIAVCLTHHTTDFYFLLSVFLIRELCFFIALQVVLVVDFDCVFSYFND